MEKKGIQISLVDARFAKPLDEKLILEMASNHELILTIEEGSIGGFGSHVMKLLSDRGVFDSGLKFRSMFLPDVFIDQDSPEKMYEKAGLNSNSIVEKIEEALKSNIIFAKNKNKLSAEFLGRGGAWLDTGSIDDFYKTSSFVSALENRQGLKIACLEEIALSYDWIKKKDIREAISFYGNCLYSNYLKKLI